MHSGVARSLTFLRVIGFSYTRMPRMVMATARVIVLQHLGHHVRLEIIVALRVLHHIHIVFLVTDIWIIAYPCIMLTHFSKSILIFY